MRATRWSCSAFAFVGLACGGGEGHGRDSGSGSVSSGSLTIGSANDTGGSDAGDGSGGSEADDADGGTVADDGSVKFDMQIPPDLSLGCGGGGGGGGADFSYIWIANSNESTVSKINTSTMVEEGRYITRPDSAGNPSRTSVNLNGDAVIANRAGGVTMIFARHDDCPNAANTSTGPADVKAWQDGCIGWHTPLAYASNRPVAWSAGTYDNSTCRYEDVKVWTSGANNTIDVLLLDGTTGMIEQTVPIAGVNPQYYGIYGGAVDSGDNFWGLSAHDGKLVRVDRIAFSVQIWNTPAGGYGMAVDRNDRVWTCSAQVGRFDYPSQTWQTGQAGGAGGCMPDGQDLIWLANDPMVGVDIDTLAVVLTLDVPNYVHGVSIDFDGNVWGPAINNNEAYRVNPMTGQVDTITGLNLPYTYSDMTGFGLSQVGGPSG
ncbi:MAG TPA: hypothetical protein VG755_39045 [Nannocystaceae bacterium]|nr:hypothetical protein [Nannocystaceae bacterium]